MVIIFLFRVVFSKEIIASLYGIEKGQCNISNPCDFSTAKLKISKNDLLFIKDNYADSLLELEKLRDIFQYALYKKCYVVSQNMTINGSLLNSINFPFIINNGADECQIAGFIFTEFHYPIFCFRGVKKVFLNECYFYNNTITNQVGLLILSFSTCKILNCDFCQNSINKTSMLCILTSFCIIECCNINSNTICHSSHQGMIFSSNSNCDFVNVTMKLNWITHSAPLIQFEWRSYIAFYNSSFISNYYSDGSTQEHKSLILCDGICEISMYESFIINNNCSSLSITTKSSVIYMNSMNISYNQAGNFALFDVPAANFTFSKASIIEKNSFSSFVDFHNLKSEMTFHHAHFRLNNSTDSLIKMSRESNINLEYSSFYDNHCQNGIINGNNIYLNFFNNGFINNVGQCINCQNCSAQVYSDVYITNIEIPINITANKSSTTIIFGSYFSNNLTNHMKDIVLKGKSLLLMLRFNHSYTKLSSSCFICYYNQRKSGVFTFWSVSFSYLSTIFLMILIVTYFKRMIKKIRFNQNKKKQ
ncbi:hypothetical protein M9Y10_044381 [Tritrichomonas musculus]|uniref:Right handed beta helix domain-containing protein n=1 Tax=Tritrichomonas musculus TaxID=1915356 RepID=A0ABR2JS56_9EUKA